MEHVSSLVIVSPVDGRLRRLHAVAVAENVAYKDLSPCFQLFGGGLSARLYNGKLRLRRGFTVLTRRSPLDAKPGLEPAQLPTKTPLAERPRVSFEGEAPLPSWDVQLGSFSS